MRTNGRTRNSIVFYHIIIYPLFNLLFCTVCARRPRLYSLRASTELRRDSANEFSCFSAESCPTNARRFLKRNVYLAPRAMARADTEKEKDRKRQETQTANESIGLPSSVSQHDGSCMLGNSRIRLANSLKLFTRLGIFFLLSSRATHFTVRALVLKTQCSRTSTVMYTRSLRRRASAISVATITNQ